MDNNTIIKASALVVGGVAVGGVGGYFLAKKRLESKIEAKYAAFTDEAVASVKETYKRMAKAEEFSTPQEAVEALIPTLAKNSQYGKTLGELGYLSEVAPSDLADALPFVTEQDVSELEEMTALIASGQAYSMHPEMTEDERNAAEVQHLQEQAAAYSESMRQEPLEDPPVINIWDREEDPDGEEHVWAPPADTENPLDPYWIPIEEFMDDGKGFEKISIDYYEADNTLIDDRESIVPDIDACVGEANLDRFGDGAQNEDTLYVRNEHLQADFEITRYEGAYSVMVLGMDESLLDPNERRPRVRKMRDDRDGR